jgi:hypothetical protein
VPSPQTFHADDRIYIAFWNNVVILDVGGDMDVACMRKVGLAYRALLTSYPRGIVALALIRPETPVAAAEARSESARFMRELGDSLMHVAMVIEDRGVIAQMLRSVVRGINVLARTSRISLSGTLEEATLALAPMVIGATRSQVPSELTAAVDAVRAAFRPGGESAHAPVP